MSKREFVVHETSNNEIFVGTVASISNIAAQLIVSDAVKPLNLEPTNTFMDLHDDNGYFCVGVGFKLTPTISSQDVKQVLQNYEQKTAL